MTSLDRNGTRAALPRGWERLTVEELTTVCRRGRGPAYEGGSTPVVNQRCVGQHAVLDLSPVKMTNEQTKPIPDWAVLQAGDVLVNSTGTGTLGRVSWIRYDPGRLTADSHVSILRPRADRVRPAFLGWSLHAREQDLVAAGTGSTNQRELSPTSIKVMEIALPPLEDQDRLLALLEARLRTIAEGERSVQLGHHRLSPLRASILHRALNKGWPRVQLRDALESLRNGMFVSRPGPSPPGIPIFRISAVRPLALDIADVRYAPADLNDYERFLVHEGDLLFTRYSGNANYVGACARVPELPRPTLHPDKLIRGVVNRSIADPRFLEIACSAGQSFSEIRERCKTTAGQVGIAGGQLATISVPLPTLKEQEAIVREVTARLEAVARLEAELGRIEDDVADLRRTVLCVTLAGGHDREGEALAGVRGSRHA